MARLPDYEAPTRELTPSDKGANAFEQAGRRIGPAYNEAATLVRQAGEAQADVIRSRKWPFDMLELTRSLDVWKQAEAKAQSAGVAFKVEGGSGGGGRGGILDDPSNASGGKGHKSRRGSDVGGMSVAAAGLGQIAGQLAKGNGYRNSEIVNGKDILDPKVQEEMKKQRQIDTVLKDGKLMHYDHKTGQYLDKGQFDKEGNPLNPNSEAEKGAEAWARGDYSDPNSAAFKKFERQYGYNPNTGQMFNREDSNGNLSGGQPTGALGPDYASNGYDRFGNPYAPRMPGSMGDQGLDRNPNTGEWQSQGGSFWDLSPNSDRGAIDAIRGTISWMDRSFGSGQGSAGPQSGDNPGGDPWTGAGEPGEDNSSGDYGGGSDSPRDHPEDYNYGTF